MYEKYYGLKLKPFENNPDPKFLWLGKKHREALASLEKSVHNNSGLILLAGGPGTGKTTLVNALDNMLGRNHLFARVSDCSLDEFDFYMILADVLGIRKKINTKENFMVNFSRFVSNEHANNRKVVLIIDEAQRLNPELIEPIRLLSNLWKHKKPRVNIIFIGNKEATDIFEKNEALRQELIYIPVLEPLTEFEIKIYVKYRLEIAGSERKIFNRGTYREIYAFSGGIPRMINNICDLSLSAGYKKGIKIISPDIIKQCAARYKNVDAYCKIGPSMDSWKMAYVVSAAMVIPVIVFSYFYFNNNAMPIKESPHIEGAIGPVKETISKGQIQNLNQTSLLQDNDSILRIVAIDFKAPEHEEMVQLARVDQFDQAIELDTTLKELESAKAQITTLKGQLAARDQMLMEYKQNYSKLEQTQFLEKENTKVLQADIISKMTLISELQNKIETKETDTHLQKNNYGQNEKDFSIIETQLVKLNTQKTSDESLINQLKARNNKLSLDIARLQKIKKQIVVLENELAKKEKMLSQSQQGLIEIKKLFEQERENKERLQSAVSSKTSIIKDLQNRIKGMGTVPSSFTMSSDDHNEQKEPITIEKPLKRETEQPNPGDIIDWVIKKRSQQ